MKMMPEKKVDVSVSKGVHKQNLGNFMEERLRSHKHDFSISAEWIGARSGGIGGAVKTTCSQVNPP